MEIIILCKKNENELKTDFYKTNFMKIPTRSWSGVLPISVALEGQKFSCRFDCSFCPNETKANGAQEDIARSYLSTEGTFKRGKVCDWDGAKQVIRRLAELESMGHFPDKLEIIVLGGTWDCYSSDYRETFLHRVFYGANVYQEISPILKGHKSNILLDWLDKNPFVHKMPLDFEPEHIRPMQELEMEKAMNQFAIGSRIIGIVLETRPDQISKLSLTQMRRLGCTRIQLGVQHTSDMILDFNRRGHKTRTSIASIQKCKENGYKVDIHIMPDLPLSSATLDLDMFHKIFRSEDFQPDYVKVYPCLDLPFTQTRKWKQEGVWISYAENNYPLFLRTMALGLTFIPPWTRVNRVHRDFPEATEKNQFLGYESETLKTNLHQLIHDEIKRQGLRTVDIRSREIKRNQVDLRQKRVFFRQYWANGAKEWFISVEIPKPDAYDLDDAWLLGFVRLRLPSPKNIYKSSSFSLFREGNWGKIRELHVYGFIANTQDKESVQHKGIGKCLMSYAEKVAAWEGCCGTSVISGVGVRNYYWNLGYELTDDESEMMVKRFKPWTFFIHPLYLFLWMNEKGWWVHKKYDFARANLFVLPYYFIYGIHFLIFTCCFTNLIFRFMSL